MGRADEGTFPGGSDWSLLKQVQGSEERRASGQRAQQVQRHKGLLCVWFALVGVGGSGRWWKKPGEKGLEELVPTNPGGREVSGGSIHARCLFTLHPQDHGQAGVGM